MQNNLLKKVILFSISFLPVFTYAQAPSDYYDSVEGTKKDGLKTALFNVIKSPSVTSYDGLWTSFRTTDKRSDGKVWDMYSDKPGGTPSYSYTFGTNQCGNYSGEGSCYNREHSFPKSWFDDAKPMYSDLFHLYPTDGYVNGRRSNYPFGEVGVSTWKSTNGSKVGQNTVSGYTGTVFEPIDEYKGDFARTYFYMVTCYEDKVVGWYGNAEAKPTLNGTKYPAFNTWVIGMLLKWHRDDPVSEKETDRNNAVYKIQKNRNPFIDHPELAEYIWGDKTDEVFYFGTVGIDESTNEKIYTLSYKDNALKIENNDKDGVVEIFDSYGRNIIKQRISAGDSYINVPADQLLIVRLHGISTKLYTR